jgi:predicted nucleotidyltransferase
VGEATREFFLSTLADTVARFEDQRVDYLLIGGLAMAAVLGLPCDTEEDIDVFVRPEDAERLLEVFAAAGYATHRRDEHWVYKVARPNVTVDLIFRAGERIVLDDDHLRRARPGAIDGIKMPVAGVEDLVVMKAIFDSPDRPGRWYQCLRLLQPADPDWGYLAERALQYAPARVLSLLLYATTAGLPVPSWVLRQLCDVVSREAPPGNRTPADGAEVER